MKKITIICLLFILFFALYSFNSYSQTVVTITEGAEGWFPQDTINSDPNYYWDDVTTGTEPICTPHGGSWMAEFDSYFAGVGVYSAFITSPFDLTQRGANVPKVKFWIYRDNGYSTNADKIQVYANTTNSLTGATLLTSTTGSYTEVNRSRSLAPAGAATDGWYQYSFDIPAGFNTAVNYLLVKATSAYGNRIYLDDFTYDTYPTGGSTQRQPFGMFWGYERSASIFTSGEVASTGGVSALKWDIYSLSSACTGNVKIYLKSTAAAVFNASDNDVWSTLISGATLVYDGTPTFSSGVNTFTLSQPYFNYSSGNLLVLIETNYASTGGESPDAKKVKYVDKTSAHEIWYQDNNPPGSDITNIWDVGEINDHRPKMDFSTVIIATPTITLSAPTNNSYLATNANYSFSWAYSGTLPVTQDLTIEGTAYNGVTSPQTNATASTNPSAASYTWSVKGTNAYGNQTSSRTYYRKKTITPTTSYQTTSFSLPSPPSGTSSFYYQVSLTTGRHYIFSTCNHEHTAGKGAAGGSATFDTYLELLDASFAAVTPATNLVNYNDDCGSGGNQSFIDFSCTSTATYYLKVRGYNASSFGDYVLGYKYYVTTGGTPGLWIGGSGGCLDCWNTAANWDDGVAPTSTTDVVIPSGRTYYPILQAGSLGINDAAGGCSYNCKTLKIETGASVSVDNASGYRVSIKDEITIYGTFNHKYADNTTDRLFFFLVEANGIVTIKNGGILNVGSNAISGGIPLVTAGNYSKFNDIKINGGSFTVETGGTVFIQDCLNLTSGTFTQSGGMVSISREGIGSATTHKLSILSGATFNMTSGTFQVSGDVDGATMTYNAINVASGALCSITGGTFEIKNDGTNNYNATILIGDPSFEFYNLTITKSGKTAYLNTNNIKVNGDLLISAGTFSCNNLNITTAGNWTNNDVFTGGSGTVTLTGFSKNITGSTSSVFNNLTIKNGASYTVTGGLSFVEIDGTYNQEGNTTINLASGKYLDIYSSTAQSETVTFNGNINAVSKFDLTRDVDLNKTVIFTGGGLMNADLRICSGFTANVTMGSDFILNGNFEIQSTTTFTMSSSVNQNYTIGGNWTNSGTFTRGIGTVIFNGTLDRTIDAGCSRGYASNASKDFYNIKINCASNKKVGLINTALTIQNDLEIISGSLYTDNGLTDGTGQPPNGELCAGTPPLNYQSQVMYVKGNTIIYNGANLFVGYQCVGNRTDEGLTTYPGQNTNVPMFEHNLTLHGTITTNRPIGPVNGGYSDIFIRGSKITGDGDANEFGVDLQPIDGYTVIQDGPVDIKGDLIIQDPAANTWQNTNAANVLTIRGNLYLYGSFSHNGTVNVYGNLTNGVNVIDGFDATGSTFNFYHNAGGNKTIRLDNPASLAVFNNINIKTNADNGIRELRQDITVNGDLTIETGRILDANNHNLNIAGNWTDNGFFRSTGSTLTLSGFSTTFSNNNLTNNTTTAFCGVNVAIGGGLSTDQYQIFDCTSPFTIVSVKVTATGTGNRTIYIKNSAGTLLNSIVANIPSGTSRVTLNFHVNPGLNYRLGISDFTGGTISRDLGGITGYPFSIGTFGSITGNSTANNANWYYLYDWEYVGDNFNNLVINKSTASNTVTISNDLKVYNTLTLTNGIIATGTNKVICTNTNIASNNCTSISGLTNNSYINGNFRQYIAPSTASEGYYLPVGSSSAYRLARFISPASAVTGISYVDACFLSAFSNTGTMSLTETAISPNTTYNNICSEGIWRINGDVYPTGGTKYDIMLYFNGGGANAFAGLTDMQFGIVKRPDLSTTADTWVSTDGAPSTTVTAGYGRLVSDGYARRYGLSTFSEYAIAKSNYPLPITLLTFSATANGKQVDLKWTTSSEINNDYFIVESSKDLGATEQVGKVPGAGNSNSAINYFLIDKNPYSGISYYRLKQTDFDGNFTYSEWAAVEFKTQESFEYNNNNNGSNSSYSNTLNIVNVYPNPTKGELFVTINSSISQSVQYSVIDLMGRKHFNGNINLTEGISRLGLELEDFSPGTYILIISGKNEVLQRKVVKQ